MRDRTYPQFLVSQGDTPLEQALAARLVGDMNLLRLKASARLLARGLDPEIHWWDLLQEAFARVLNGSRRCPPDVPIDAFMTGVMRSIRTEYWRRKSRSHALRAKVTEPHSSMPVRDTETRDSAPDPERTLLAQQELEAIEKLFADDPIALQIIAGLGDGLSAEEICAEYSLTRTAYDSARKRMRRVLLREGIRWKVV